MADKDELYRRAVELNKKLMDEQPTKQQPRINNMTYDEIIQASPWSKNGKDVIDFMRDQIRYETDRRQEAVMNALYHNRNEQTLKVDALLMFGPCHGMKWRVKDGEPEILAVAMPVDVPRFEQYEPGMPYPPTNRGKAHRYRFDQMYSSMNGEDCAMYVHHESCCPETIPEPEVRPRTNYGRKRPDIF